MSPLPLPRSLGEDSIPSTASPSAQRQIPSHSWLSWTHPTRSSHSLEHLPPPKMLLSDLPESSERSGATRSSSAKAWRGCGCSRSRQECVIANTPRGREGCAAGMKEHSRTRKAVFGWGYSSRAHPGTAGNSGLLFPFFFFAIFPHSHGSAGLHVQPACCILSPPDRFLLSCFGSACSACHVNKAFPPNLNLSEHLCRFIHV